MKKIDTKKFNKIYQNHLKWLAGESGGSRAELYGYDLTLTDFYRKKFSGAIMYRCDFTKVDASYVNFSGANLSESNFFKAKLKYANLTNAELFGANFVETDLLSVKTDQGTRNFYIACPEEGSFIAYKKAQEKIVVLEILEDARRSSATSLDCRCDKAKVLRIENLDGSIAEETSVVSDYDPTFVYTIDGIVSVNDFEEDRWKECSKGIHFFLSKECARRYAR